MVPTSLARQSLGFVLAVVGLQILGWAVESAAAGSGSLVSVVVHTAIGTFVVLNGLYLGGVRFR